VIAVLITGVGIRQNISRSKRKSFAYDEPHGNVSEISLSPLDTIVMCDTKMEAGNGRRHG
jgi:hypothetical protein